MEYNHLTDCFRQEVPFQILLRQPLAAGSLNVVMKTVGMQLFYDTYAMPREGDGIPWQSDTYANVDTFLGGQRSDAQDGCDRLVVSYPLATIDARYIPKFAELLEKLSAATQGELEYEGQTVTGSQVEQVLRRQATLLMEEWGEEPGSKELRVLIETNR